ncbi:Uncharacterized protein GBIM_14902 [Gryllus bimaculatus]|nr:Uncharacterized protein GBIM_14902 [Gryllus bimaculatus]
MSSQGQHHKQLSPVTDAPVPCDRFSDITSHYSSDDDSSSDGNISEESAGHVQKMRSSPKLKKNKHAHHHGKHRLDGCRQWLANLSIRSNQDNQREYEENLMRQMIQALTRRTCGGTYVRLEQEWKEAANHGRYSGQLARQRSTNSLSARLKLRVSR